MGSFTDAFAAHSVNLSISEETRRTQNIDVSDHELDVLRRTCGGEKTIDERRRRAV